MASRPGIYTIAKKQNRANSAARGKEAEFAGETELQVTDEGPDDVKHVIHIYNCIPGLRHDPIQQPPNFALFKVPYCEPGQKFGHTTIPGFVRNRYNRPGTSEYYYQREDGSKSATSLLNPSVHPASPWETQLQEIAPGTPGVATDQFGSNLNAYGVWWSRTAPDDASLAEEIELFKQRAERTFKALVEQAEQLYAANERKAITPRMHFAMDYLGLSAPWHQSTARMTPCPNCGMQVREGLAYHKNEFGEKCIIDRAKYDQLFPPMLPEEEETEHVGTGRKSKKSAA